MKILITGLDNPFDKIIIPNIIKKSDEVDIFVSPDYSLDQNLLGDNCRLVQMNLSNIPELKEFLNSNAYDLIYHNTYTKYEGKNQHLKKAMFHKNVDATEQLIINAMRHESRLLYQSTLAIYGNDPKRLPITNRTETFASSFYVSTRIRAERLVENYVLRGLNAQIVRHSFFYGRNYPGILKHIIDLKNSKMLYLKHEDVKRNVTNIDNFIIFLKKIIETNFKPGMILNIVDPEPIKTYDIITLIYNMMDEKDPPSYILKNNLLIELWRKSSSYFSKHLLATNISFLTRSKYLDIDYVWDEVVSKSIDTLNQIKILLQNYIKNEGKRN